ncbi:uncharacterized protein LOC114544491 [Dendronephthya gigantea]|uniref:uncharacterized protein LOC114544491 n=1 Tax=Dendronephthya gigantea TaxID=151771 RepID=UPI00106DCEC5|nr:uncharacterized protein LOC114544491 [Dendronephthya gigantea]
MSKPHHVRKTRLSANWEKIRAKLTQTSLLLEGFIPPQCSNCSNMVEARCRDCEFGAYYCLECCNSVHRNKNQFHLPEVFQDGCWIKYEVPGRILSNPFHACSGTYRRSITVIDINGMAQ